MDTANGREVGLGVDNPPARPATAGANGAEKVECPLYYPFVDPTGECWIATVDSWIDGFTNRYIGLGGIGAGFTVASIANFKFKWGIGAACNKVAAVGTGWYVGWNTGKIVVNLTDIEDRIGGRYYEAYGVAEKVVEFLEEGTREYRDQTRKSRPEIQWRRDYPGKF